MAKSKKKKEDNLTINGSFDDVIGASMSNISLGNSSTPKPVKKPSAKKKGDDTGNRQSKK